MEYTVGQLKRIYPKVEFCFFNGSLRVKEELDDSVKIKSIMRVSERSMFAWVK